MVQTDGKIVVGGAFTSLGGSTRNRIARLNANGTLDTTFNPGANSNVQVLALQADGRIVVGGTFTSLGGSTRNRIGRLNANGSLDTTFNPGVTGQVNEVVVQADGKILVGGGFTVLGGVARDNIGRLNANGSLDTTFNPGVTSMSTLPSTNTLAVQADGKIVVGGGFNMLGVATRNNIGRLYPGGELDDTLNPGVMAPQVYALTLQADGKILVGGAFTVLGGSTRNGIGRLNADGTLDTTFDPNPGSQLGPQVNAVGVQGDGKIVVGGSFTTLGGQTHNNIGRLNANGTPDATFTAGATGGGFPIAVLAVQADGKIVVGGNFDQLGDSQGSIARNRIGRFNADGTLDQTFNPNANNLVSALAVQADGKILVGGNFTTLGGSTRNRIARLNANGSLDTTFNPNANNIVSTLAVQADGKILVGGNFTTLGGSTRNQIARLNADGSLDTTFNPGVNSGGSVSTLAVQADGKILVGGFFTTLGGSARNNLGRLNADGSLDTTFNPGADQSVFGLALQADGKIVVGGAFATLGGQSRMGLGRLTNTAVAFQDLSVTPGSITWQRSGSSPEVPRVTFELSSDATTFVSLGAGSRITGGWQLTGLGLLTGQNLFIRARGFYSTGQSDSSDSIVESVRNVFLVCPTSTAALSGGGTVCSGTSSSIAVTVTGGAPPYSIVINNGVGTVNVPNNSPFNISVSPTSPTTYTITSGTDASGCPVTPGSSATVTVNPLPTVFNITGGGSFCTGGSGVAVGLSGSQFGINYQLLRGVTAVGSPVPGTGSAISFGNQTTAGTYTVTATNPATTCSRTMTGSATVTVNPLPTAFTVTGGGGYCTGGSGVAVGLSGSQSGVNYQLLRGGTPTGSPVAGTGSAISFGNQTTAGTYTVTASASGCNATMTGSATVTVNPAPTAFTVTGGGVFCFDSPGVMVGLSGSQTGVNYQLLLGGSPVGSPVAGTGTSFNFVGLQETAGTYTVTASAGGCNATMTGSATVTVNPAPTAFTVTGGGSYCTGGSGVAVGLSGSQSGVNYQLLVGSTPVGSPVAGTGSAISFGNQTTAGTYTVTATNATTGCTSTMTGNVTVTVSPALVVFTVTPGGSFCAGGGGVAIGLSGSQTGVNYQLMRGTPPFGGPLPVGSPVPGTGSAISFGNQTQAGFYTVSASNGGCSRSMNGSVTINSLPTVYTVTGGGGYCTGGSGVAVGLSDSETGVSYRLLRGGTPVGSQVAGTGSAISFGNQTTAGTYTVTATNSLTSCARTMAGSVTVTVNPLPTAFMVTGGGGYCTGGSGVAVGLSGSETGVNYQLLVGGTPVGSPVAGTGTSISFGNQITTGTYTVTATNATTSCAQAMTGSVTVTVNPVPTAFSVTGGGVYCSGQGGVAVGLSGSQSGLTYQLLRGGTPVGGPVAGTGTALSFGNQTTAGTYTVTASASGCMATMTGNATVTVNPSPAEFNVTGGGGYCSGGSGAPVGLSGSEVGVDYLLFRDNTSVGTSIPGTGSALAFGNQTLAGTYSVTATNATTGCTTIMNTTPMVTVNPAPTAFTVTGGGSFCAGDSGVGVGLSGSQSGVSYQLMVGATPVGSPVAGTGAALSFGNQTTAGIYTVTASASGCNTTMTGSAMVTVIPLPTAFTVTGGGSFCTGGSGVAVGLSGSQTGVNYQLLVGATPVGSPVPGTGAAVSFGNQTGAGTYTVTASASGCNATMTGSATVTIIPLATVNAGPNQTVCSNFSAPVTLAAVLGGSATGGTWSGGGGVFTPDNTAPDAIYLPTAGEISAGSVTLTYTPVGACPGVSDSMTISFVECNTIGLMVADTTNNRIQGFDGIDWFTIGTGGIGSGPGQFRQPEAVAYDAGGRIFVADTGNNRIQFSTDGGSIWADFATNGTGPDQVRAPQGVALDSDGNLYVSDTGNGRVLRFAGGMPGLATVLASHGTASGQVGSPMGLAIDSTFQLFIADAGNSRVLRIANANTTALATSGVAIATAGTALNKVIAPQGITIDGNGDLYVADTGNSRILKWKNANPTTANSSAMALTGSGLGQVRGAEGVSVTQFITGPYAGGQILVIGDTGNNRIQGRSLPTGGWTLIGAPNGIGSGVGQFRSPSKIR